MIAGASIDMGNLGALVSWIFDPGWLVAGIVLGLLIIRECRR